MAFSPKLFDGTNIPYEPESGATNTLYGISGTSYTLARSEVGKELQAQNGSTTTITIPTNASVPFPIGTVFTGHQYGAGQVDINADVGVTIRTAYNAATTTRARYSSFAMRKIGTDEWLVFGDLTA